jgi:hypothetical protein
LYLPNTKQDLLIFSVFSKTSGNNNCCKCRMFQAESVSDAAWGCDWIGTPVSFQRCLIFIIATARREFTLTAGKFASVSRETMLKVSFIPNKFSLGLCLTDTSNAACLRFHVVLYNLLRCVHITRARASARQACARRETRLDFTCVRKSSSTLLQLLARFRRVRIRIFTRSVYRL